jgi:predicted metal-dependent peptidase
MNAPISIDKARDWALRTPHAVFYGVLASNLRDIMDTSIQTAATDGKVIKWNPDFIARLSDEEVRGVLLHETMHCALSHFWRLPITRKGNVAGDYAINSILTKIPGLKLPAGCLLDAKFDGMAEEEILAALAQKKQEEEKEGEGDKQDSPAEGQDKPAKGDKGDGEGQDSQGQDEGGCGAFEAPAPDAPDAKQTLAEKWEGAILQADYVAKSSGAGDAPAEMQRIIDAVRVISPAWKQEMAEFIKSAVSSRNDWSRSTRRMATARVIYPRKRVDGMETVVFVRDTSGSIDGQILNEFNALVESALADTECSAVIIDADASVNAEYRLARGETVPQTAKGGGGTDFRPAFNRIAEMVEAGEQVAGVVYLTDLEGPQPDSVEVPTLWLCTTENKARTGRTVRVK